ncbi:lysozyme-like protein [Exidia glandulosa HHB12029]|uniref:Lysozyme-like protein n=1 Tax=Exidia glandulosa HHB12029 TaxID=1314781 RepID=A0A165ZGN4_EXIGL|nr:lysozyme-like protein [Exidia glandulosa HHB12029]
MKGVFTSSALVVALLCLDAVSVSARRNGTHSHSLARKRSGHHKRACTKTPLPPAPTSTELPPSSSTELPPPSSTDEPTSSSEEPAPQPTSTSTPAPPGGTVSSDFLCDGKPSGATVETTQTGGPNGDEDWLNCGLESGGWSPPPLTVDQIVYVDLDKALEDSKSPYHACEQYIDIFKKYGQQLNIPPIYIAAFALQESSCNAGTTGGAGEVGLMQITPDKCVDPPNGDCHEADYNIRIGATYFADQLKEHNGNVPLTVGAYNGWYDTMTSDQTLGQSNPCWQQNLDYMMDFFNVWLQNIDAYAGTKYGRWHNYDKCTGA